MTAGRRSSKTVTAKRKLILGTPHHRGLMTLPGGRFFYAAPTYGQAKRIAWRDFKAMTKPFQTAVSESELFIRTSIDSELWLIGMDNPARIEGSMWDGGIMDEYADMKAEAWPEHVQPVTADTNAWVDFIGVPEGRNHFYELVLMAQTMPDLFAHFTWPTADIHPEAAARAKLILDPRTYRQEYEGSFEQSSTNAYYCFTDESVTDKVYKPDVESYLCWDFNAGEKPMATVLVQWIDGEWVATREWVTPFTNTEAQCESIRNDLEAFKGTLEVTGDYAGRRRESSASFSDYQIIESFFKNYRGYRVKTRPTLSVRDRVASTNSMLLSASGMRRLKVSRSCPKLIEDLRKTEWKENGVQLDESDPDRTHPSDALSYWAYNYHPVDRRKPVTNVN